MLLISLFSCRWEVYEGAQQTRKSARQSKSTQRAIMVNDV